MLIIRMEWKNIINAERIRELAERINNIYKLNEHFSYDYKRILVEEEIISSLMVIIKESDWYFPIKAVINYFKELEKNY